MPISSKKPSASKKVLCARQVPLEGQRDAYTVRRHRLLVHGADPDEEITRLGVRRQSLFYEVEFEVYGGGIEEQTILVGQSIQRFEYPASLLEISEARFVVTELMVSVSEVDHVPYPRHLAARVPEVSQVLQEYLHGSGRPTVVYQQDRPVAVHLADPVQHPERGVPLFRQRIGPQSLVVATQKLVAQTTVLLHLSI
ncbi:MAG: hypothetical protein ACR2KW_03825 [Rubrobacter sp.]